MLEKKNSSEIISRADFWYIFKHYESYLILLEDAVDEVAGGPINEPIESSKKLLLLPLTFAEVDNLLGLLKQK